MGTTVLAEEDRPQPIVGAIRWNAFYGQEGAVKEVERSLGAKKFHFRLPFFAKISSDATVTIDGDSQEIMDREIAYAADAGLNYWAFVDYWEEKGLTIALRRYMDAKDKHGLRFCFIEEGGWLIPTLNANGTPNTERLDAIRFLLKKNGRHAQPSAGADTPPRAAQP